MTSGVGFSLLLLLTLSTSASEAIRTTMGKGAARGKAPGRSGSIFEKGSSHQLEEEDELGLAAEVDPAGDISVSGREPGGSNEAQRQPPTFARALDMAIEDWDTGEEDEDHREEFLMRSRKEEDAQDPAAEDSAEKQRQGRQLSSPQKQQLVTEEGDGGDDGESSDSIVEQETEKKPISWKAFGCFISTGGDILSSPRRVTVPEAKRLCAESPDCRGFTFSSKAPASKRRAVHFKNKFDCGGTTTGWTAFRKVERPVKPLWQQKPLTAPWRKPALAKVQKLFQNLTVLSANPPVWQFDGFLTEVEMARLRGLGASVLEGVARPFGGASSAKSGWLSREEDLADPVLQNVDAKVAKIVGLPKQNQEPAQVLHYGVGDGYSLHHDRLETQARQPCGVRVASFFMYLGGGGDAGTQGAGMTSLTSLTTGGELRFPELGLTVVPVPGRALLWWNVDPAQIEQGMPHKMDRRTVHEALPLESGEKWAVNKWIHMNDFQTPYFQRLLD